VAVHSLDSKQLTANVRPSEYVKGLEELAVDIITASVLCRKLAGRKYFSRTSDVVQFYTVTSKLATHNAHTTDAVRVPGYPQCQ